MVINGIVKIIDGHSEPKKNVVKFINDQIYVNGTLIGSGYQGTVEVVWLGPIANVEATNIKIKGDVNGNIDCTNVNISGSVTGDIDGVNVTCGNVTGNVDATVINRR